MQVVAILNQKGGVGKTTTAITFGHGLALRGRRVLIVDLDAQGNVADALGVEKNDGLYRFIVEGAGPDAVTPSGRERLDLILGDHHTVQAKRHLVSQDFRERILIHRLHELQGYDVAILDVAPGVDVLQVSALAACEMYLIPVALDHLAVVGAADALKSAAALKQAGGLEGELLGILPTFWERRTNESAQQLRLLVEQFEKLIWPPIPLDVKAREAPAHGESLWEYAPDCRALVGVKLNGDRPPAGGYRQALDRLIEVLEAKR